MCSLSNNGSNARALGPWYVNSNNVPSNANANNWGARVKSATIGTTESVVEGRGD